MESNPESFFYNKKENLAGMWYKIIENQGKYFHDWMKIQLTFDNESFCQNKRNNDKKICICVFLNGRRKYLLAT